MLDGTVSGTKNGEKREGQKPTFQSKRTPVKKVVLFRLHWVNKLKCS